ncbi:MULTISPECIES: GNAT family N-acetyltransferase [Modicisalibacter]|uniref:GNAT family N-acetyltransferase n=1 Tax=Modicisalibacter TaxID=574347 RepID=UPI00100AD8B5|nr:MULTISPECIES: GNAT family N-acetyltransferase [Halomonadaceae]MBZ9557388.1 GNAT family N-acetyltransferase [Modicisalibacter sp. R2A 31.J]MBZ9573946.1 GNAT family N-acetyltransferase [Modicisalibacter sp. MOD 31.J]
MNERRLHIERGDWQRLGPLAAEIRRRVFIDEQAVPEAEEWDGRDPECVHFLAWHEATPVGTARLLPDGHVGRVAVLPDGRGLGIGLALMREAIQAARDLGHASIELAAQTHALDFYRRLGFEAHGELFLDAGIAHRNMRLSLND